MGNKVKRRAHASLQAATEHVASKTCWQAIFKRRNYKDRRIRKKMCEKGGRDKGKCENYLIFEPGDKKVQNILKQKPLQLF